jgi:hypothetical protein
LKTGHIYVLTALVDGGVSVGIFLQEFQYFLSELLVGSHPTGERGLAGSGDEVVRVSGVMSASGRCLNRRKIT